MHSIVEKAVFDDVPAVILEAEDVDMRVWAVLTTDNTLRTVGKLHRERKFPVNRGVRMNKADKITDAGLKVLSEAVGTHLLVRPLRASAVAFLGPLYFLALRQFRAQLPATLPNLPLPWGAMQQS